jgi:hypothetical protein
VHIHMPPTHTDEGLAWSRLGCIARRRATPLSDEGAGDRRAVPHSTRAVPGQSSAGWRIEVNT